MDDGPIVEALTGQIRSVAGSGAANARNAIERLLEQAMGHLSHADKLRMLREVAAQFVAPEAKDSVVDGLRSTDSSRIVSLFLGREIVGSGLSSKETSAKLAKSLNTIFDTLNQIIGTIHSTLLGQKGAEETIRQIIGSEIEGEAGDRSLQGYLDQIQQAFLIAHQAFRMAGESIVTQILSELDPQRMMGSAEGRLRFGILRKAEFFDTYRDKYQACKDSFESGRITEELLREFEKACQRLYKR